jgi:multiple sugar transport system permease protein
MARGIGVHVPLILGSLLMVLPFVFMFSTSLNAQAWLQIPFPAQIVPAEFSTKAYTTAIEGMNLGRLYLNTILIAVVQIGVSLVSALLSGYALSKIRPRGSRFMLILILTTMMIPAEASLIPNFLTFKDLGMLNTYLPFWIPALAYTFGTFFVKQYLDGLPDELREAAKLDGAGELRILFAIYTPLAKPVLATCTILLFLGIWNSFLWPLVVINDPSLYTIQLGISQFATSSGGSTYLLPAVNMAATVLSVVPVLVVYLFLQRYVVESVASTAVKG